MTSRTGEDAESGTGYGSPRVSRHWKTRAKEQFRRGPPDADEKTPLLGSGGKGVPKDKDADAKTESVITDLRKELEMDSHRISLEELYTRFDTDPDSVSFRLGK